MAHYVRETYCYILCFCDDVNSRSLYEKFKESMIDDFTYKGDSRNVAEFKALLDIEETLSSLGSDIRRFNLPKIVLEDTEDLTVK